MPPGVAFRRNVPYNHSMRKKTASPVSLEKRMIRAGIDRNMLAEHIGVHPVTVWRWMRDAIECPDDMRRRILKIWEYALDEMEG